jgi:hypothetical protein
MTAVPAETPDNIPDEEPIPAMDELLLVQVPPPASVSVVLPPAQIVVVPDMADGEELTVTVIVAAHPEASI